MEISGNITSLSYWQEHEAECIQYLNDPRNWNNVACLNSVAVNPGTEPQLVRFTCMIQDMHDTEIYMEQYQLTDIVTFQARSEKGKYRDVPTCQIYEDVVEDPVHTKNGERRVFCCISVPAVNFWAKQSPHKCEAHHTENKQPVSDSETICEPSAKRFCPTFQPTTRNLKQDIQVSLPLQDTQAIVCYVVVYDTNLTLSMNEMIEVVGFVSMKEEFDDGIRDTDEFNHVFIEPNLSIPRLHAVATRKLQHCNPLLQHSLTSIDEIVADANRVRQELKYVLSQALLGDQLAAEYLICHLISTVYQRSDVLTLGQLCLNIFKVPVTDGYCSKLYTLMEKMLTKSHYEALTLDNLNKSTFIPKKNYEKNVLQSGKLQLSANTHLVLDETCTESGNLYESGVRNVAALQVLIMQQKVDYDFNFYPVEIHANIPVLILSEGRSFLSSNVLLPLEVDEKSFETRNEIFEGVNHYLQEHLLQRIRKYLTVMRMLEYSIPQDLEKVIQDDFVKLRIENGSKISASDLHLMLVLARLISLSRGERVLSGESWRLACNLELQRKQRIELQRHPL